MSDTIQRQLAGLQKMTTGELVRRYAELHGQQCRTRHRAYLIRKIAWRIQANAEGDLSDRARRRAAASPAAAWSGRPLSNSSATLRRGRSTAWSSTKWTD
jgi:hypothetical protein